MKKNIMLILIVALLVGCAQQRGLKKGFSPTQSLQKEAAAHPDKLKITSVFYPMPPEKPRLQLLRSFSLEDLREFQGGSKYYLQIKRAYDIGAVKGKVYISDRTYKKIIVLDLKNKELTQISGDYESAGIWVTEDDYKYVADFESRQIIVFDDKNNPSWKYHDSQFDKPVDVAVFENRVYVVDINKHEVFVLDKKKGNVVSSIGGIGKEEGKFYKPTHVIVDTDGNLYVNDFFNLRIQKFDQDGNFVKKFGRPGDTLGAFARPKGLGLDREGHLYVVDAAFENVQIFDDETTELLLFFGGFGLDPGSMYLPNGIYIDYQNIEYFQKYTDRNFSLKYLVYVGNTLGPIKLNVYGFGEWTGPPLGGNEESAESQ